MEKNRRNELGLVSVILAVTGAVCTLAAITFESLPTFFAGALAITMLVILRVANAFDARSNATETSARPILGREATHGHVNPASGLPAMSGNRHVDVAGNAFPTNFASRRRSLWRR